MISRGTLSGDEPVRKLLVSAKSWNGCYLPGQQYDGYETYEHIREVLFKKPWSPVIWTTGYRTEVNFLSSDWLVLDFDENALTLEQAKKNFSDYQHIITTTKSHTPQSHSLRVCVPWCERIDDLITYNFNLNSNAKFYDSDMRALNGARFFWPSKTLYSVNIDGEQMEVNPPPFETNKDFEFIQLNRQKNPDERELPKYYTNYLNYGLNHDSGGRNQKLWALSMDLFEEGWNGKEIFRLISKIKCRPAYTDKDYEKCVRCAYKASQKRRKVGDKSADS